jgi:hypothetical protein
MKIREILAEVRAGKVPKRFQKSSTGLHLFSDSEHANSDYTHLRLGMALAMSNGKDKLDIDPKTFYGKKHTAHPYTQAEADMLKQCYPLVGASYKDLNHGDLRSQEAPDVHKVSPVANLGPVKRRSE